MLSNVRYAGIRTSGSHTVLLDATVRVLLSAVLMLPLGVRGLIEGQFPPKGVKVFRSTVIQRGKLGTFKSLIHLLFPLLCFGFVVWGNGQIEPMMEIFQPKQGETTCIDRSS